VRSGLVGFLVLVPGLALVAPAGASADSLSALIVERQALQRQIQGIASDREPVFEQLLVLRDRMADLQQQIDRGAATVAGLEREEAQLQTAIASDQARIASHKDALASAAREQYKARDQTSLSQIFFSSHSVNQIVGRIVNAAAVNDKLHQLVLQLRIEERSLADQSAALVREQAEVQKAQTRLNGQRQELSGLAAGYQARIDSLDAASYTLLKRIRQIDDAIAAATAPPGGRTAYSRQQIIQIIRAAGARYGVSGDQLVRVANCESSLNPYAYNRRSGASGLFQFMPGTFYAHGGHNIWDPSDQSDVAARMFSQGYSYEWSCR